jgi:hypothetical protein
MAFTGTPVVTLVADNLVRIASGTGEEDTFGLAEGDSGTISLFEGTGADVELPAAFKPRPYVSSDDSVSLQAAVQVEITYTVQGVLQQPVRVVKTGTTPANFLITLTNDSASELAPVEFELYIRFH